MGDRDQGRQGLPSPRVHGHRLHHERRVARTASEATRVPGGALLYFHRSVTRARPERDVAKRVCPINRGHRSWSVCVHAPSDKISQTRNWLNSTDADSRSRIRSTRRCLSCSRLAKNFVLTSMTHLSSPTSNSPLDRNRISMSPAEGGPSHGSSGPRPTRPLSRAVPHSCVGATLSRSCCRRSRQPRARLPPPSVGHGSRRGPPQPWGTSQPAQRLSRTE